MQVHDSARLPFKPRPPYYPPLLPILLSLPSLTLLLLPSPTLQVRDPARLPFKPRPPPETAEQAAIREMTRQAAQQGRQTSRSSKPWRANMRPLGNAPKLSAPPEAAATAAAASAALAGLEMVAGTGPQGGQGAGEGVAGPGRGSGYGLRPWQVDPGAQQNLQEWMEQRRGQVEEQLRRERAAAVAATTLRQRVMQRESAKAREVRW